MKTLNSHLPAAGLSSVLTKEVERHGGHAPRQGFSRHTSLTNTACCSPQRNPNHHPPPWSQSEKAPTFCRPPHKQPSRACLWLRTQSLAHA